ncbi:AcrR family transcriptional regulator [Nocardioides ginsengisegetis]|uniref:AcrR family transcriptional regulator n=1 Tax=Nocardioides ginsengisegetis TaxID=661491 RepID=A0A7W3J2B3_9ACTN|nr:TetR/AcrR family transcriptional regulator [Nocardioides ginsengisegetis]MBA8804890.1 AcrR family transcriptional regulator [Nocardioides ginsengisegetis]
MDSAEEPRRGRHSSAPSKGDRQRERIIEVTLDLLTTTSIADLSVARIADGAGIARSGLYFYFDSKYAVLAAALDDVWAEFDEARTTPVVLDSPLPVGSIGQILRRAAQVWKAHGPLLSACEQARNQDPRLGVMWRAFIERTTIPVTAMLVQQRDAGRLKPVSSNLPKLVEVLVRMTVGALLSEIETGDDDSLDAAVDPLSAVWVAALTSGS